MTPRIRPRAAVALLAAAAALAASGCSGARESVGRSLGLTYSSPDPFNVSPRAPLRLPGDLSALPPPQPGAPSPLEPSPRSAARAALDGAGSADADAAAPSPGELALLEGAGAERADPAVRQTLAAESAAPRESRYGLTSLFGIEIDDGAAAERLDPREETERLRGEGAVTPTPTPTPPEPEGLQFDIPLAL